METNNTEPLRRSTFFIDVEDVCANRLNTTISPSMRAIHLQFLLPVNSCHWAAVQISIIPFSLREHKGQTFYFSEGSFARCCEEIRQSDIIAPISDSSEAIFRDCVTWHKWNLRAPGFWSEVPHQFCPRKRSDLCIENASRYLEQLMAQSESLESEALTGATYIDDEDNQTTTPAAYSHTRSSSRDTSSEWGTPDSKGSLKRKRKEETGTSVEAVTATADAFLERLGSTSIPDDEVSSYNALTNMKSQPRSPRGENVSRAWEMCINFARQSSQKLKYGRFLRFLSLCFFLIWEKYSDKQGKSAAREVNAKMREAGFSGHSRGLKTMRDETTLINRMAASMQETCGSEKAATLYHVVFEPSNYQLIRTINRLGNEKKSNILEHMCKSVHLESISSYPSSATSVQHIIRQYLPNLSTDAISKAIGYQPISKARLSNRETAIRNPDLRTSYFDDNQSYSAKRQHVSNDHILFEELNSPMLNTAAEMETANALETLRSDDTPFFHFPNMSDGSEFDFALNIDMSNMGVEISDVTS